jgi:hypothetical protein
MRNAIDFRNLRLNSRFNFIKIDELTFSLRSSKNCFFKIASSVSLSWYLYCELSEGDSSGAEQHSSAESSSKTVLPCGSDFSTFELPVRCSNGDRKGASHAIIPAYSDAPYSYFYAMLLIKGVHALH